MKTLGRAVLTLEWIVFALAAPVAINAAGVTPMAAFSFLGMITVLVFGAIRLLPSRSGIVVGWIIQGLALASGIVLIPMLILGAIFTGLWLLSVQLGTAADARTAAAEAASIDLTDAATAPSGPGPDSPGRDA